MGNNSKSRNVIPWLKAGDFDATIGVFFDGFTKILVGVSVMMGVMKMPSNIMYGKIVSSIGLAAFLLLTFSTYYARYVGSKTNNPDITALPAGISGGTFFVWLNAILIPVYFSTNDPIFAWKVAVIANILYSSFIFLSSFVIKYILKYVPSQAMLGSLVGGSMAWLLIASLGEGYAQPIIMIPTLFILLTFYFAKINIKKLSPAFVAVGAGTVIAWAIGFMKINSLLDSFNTIGIYIPLPQFQLFTSDAFKTALTFLPLVVAFAFSDIIAMIQSVEQAAASNEIYDRRVCMLSQSIVNLIAALFGNPFPVNYYWGHPAWKKAKAGASYAMFTGIIYLVLCASGLVAIATSSIPAAATLVLLIFAAISTGTQAFEVVEKKYYPAMIVAVAIPLFELIYGKIGGAVGAAKNAVGVALKGAGVNFAAGDVVVSASDLASSGIAAGYESLSQGSMCIAILYACILIFIIDRKWNAVAITFLVASGCAFIGLIHSSAIKTYAAPQYFWLYIVGAILFFILSLLSKSVKELQPEKIDN